MPTSLSLARTKFAPPRVRADAIQRERLLASLRASVMERSITLISAAAGFGKTTLLSQLAAADDGSLRFAWVSLDDEDNDVHHLSASIIHALDELDLIWDLEPEAVLRQFGSDDTRARKVLASIINALCSNEQQRIVLVLDDVHRVTEATALAAIGHLIERLPEHVALVLSSRTVPPLPLARLRARGQLGEFRPQEMRFTAEEARSFLARKLCGKPTPEDVEQLVVQSDGWPVGLVMIAEAVNNGEGAATAADRMRRLHAAPALFEFLAQEVLQALPQDTQDFMLRSSVLPELTPEMCETLTGRPDAAAALEDLYRRNLFVTRTGDGEAVMRFHDLFRDFLQQQLARKDPALLRDLHARAARAETRPASAIAHWLAAEQWGEAAGAIVRHGLHFISDGAALAVMRLISLLPAQQRETNPAIQLLLGSCCYMRWDMPQADQHFERAAELFERGGHAAGAGQAMFVRVMVLVVLGRLHEARRLFDLCSERVPPEHDLRGVVPVFQLWLELATGRADAARACFDEIIRIARSTDAPNLFSRMVAGGQFHAMLGAPGGARFLQAFSAALMDYAVQAGDRAQEATAAITQAWYELWTGRLAQARQLATKARNLNMLAGELKGLTLGILQIEAMLAAIEGDAATAESAAQSELEQVVSATGMRLAHGGAYVFLNERVHWILGDARGTANDFERLKATHAEHEWPFMRGSRLVGEAYVAIHTRDLARAQRLLEEALRIHERYPALTTGGTAHVPLAYTFLLQGQPARAWDALRPVATRVVHEGEVGLLLLDNPDAVAALLALEPPDAADAPLAEGMRQRWQSALVPAPARTEKTTLLDRLTARELQILQMVATGASNKRIASELFLSLHTVKRHVANIIGKLEVATRGQAAALYHRHRTSA